jgi:hypothetical protein
VRYSGVIRRIYLKYEVGRADYGENSSARIDQGRDEQMTMGEHSAGMMVMWSKVQLVASSLSSSSTPS